MLDISLYTPKKRLYLKSKAKIAVYVVADDVGKPCKIGYALDIPARMAAMQTGNWRKLHVHFLLWTPGLPVAARIERTAHERLAERHISGEWFDCHVSEAVSLINGLFETIYPTIRVFEHHETIEWLKKLPIDKRDHFPAP